MEAPMGGCEDPAEWATAPSLPHPHHPLKAHRQSQGQAGSRTSSAWVPWGCAQQERKDSELSSAAASNSSRERARAQCVPGAQTAGHGLGGGSPSVREMVAGGKVLMTSCTGLGPTEWKYTP